MASTLSPQSIASGTSSAAPGGLPWYPQALPGQHALRFGYRPLEMLQELERDYDGPVAFKFGPKGAVLVTQPELIQDVLVGRQDLFPKGLYSTEAKRFFLGEGMLASEGERHRSQRQLANPHLSRKAMPQYVEAMDREAAALAHSLNDGERFDLSHRMMLLTIAIAGDTLFGMNLRPGAPLIGEGLGDVTNLTYRIGNPIRFPLGPLPIHSNWRFTRGYFRLHLVCHAIARAKRRQVEAGESGDDVLAQFVRQAKNDGYSREMMDLVRNEIMTILLAAHDTTASVMMWTFYLLSQHPGVAAQVEAEADAAAAQGLTGMEAYQALPFTRNVLAETMRVYPPVYMLDRVAKEDTELGGYRIPKNTGIIVSAFAVHRSPRYWADPMRFDPSRWEGGKQPVHRYAYFPFGGGIRTCIGERFAWLEMALVVSRIVREWRFRYAGKEAPKLYPRITLASRHGMPMIAERR